MTSQEKRRHVRMVCLVWRSLLQRISWSWFADFAGTQPSTSTRTGLFPEIDLSRGHRNWYWPLGYRLTPLDMTFHFVRIVYSIRISSFYFNQSINQSISQTSIAPISPAKPDSVARQPNQCSTAKSRKQFRNINRPWGVTTSIGERPNRIVG